MRLISILFFAIGLCGCVTMNMNKDPSRWVTVLDSETKKPVPNLPLVYQDIKKPYFITGCWVTSREYVTNSEGVAHVPWDVFLKPSDASGWVSAGGSEPGRNSEILYVKKGLHLKYTEQDSSANPLPPTAPEDS
jgi:hypothetical protein